MSEPAAGKEDVPRPDAPPLGELFELSLTALFNAPGVFARLEARPAPGPGASYLLALAWGSLYLALNLLRATIEYPSALQAYAPWQIGAVGFFGLGLWTALYLLGASLVYGLGRALGSAGDFDRALLVAALTLSAAPAQAICRWFPMAWFAPAIVAAWILACGLSALFKAAPWAARGVCAVLAAGVLGLQYGAGLAAEKYSAGRFPTNFASGASSPYGSGAAPLAELQQVQPVVADAPKGQSPQGDSPKGDSPKANQSGLDLLRGPGAEEAPAAGPVPSQPLSEMSASVDALNRSMIGMLDSIAPMLNNPTITKNMTPRQKADYAELKTMMQDLKTGMASNTRTSSQDQQAKMLKIQQIVMRLMSAGMTMPKAAQPEPGAR